MTKYAVSVGDQQYQVEVHDSHLLVDGEPVPFELTSLNGNGLHLFRQGERSTEMYFTPTGRDGYQIFVDGHHLTARVDRAHLTPRRGRTAAVGDVTAPMPGLIVDVLVEVGEHVDADQILLIQESMKMQMQFRAPVPGEIEMVKAAIGDQVDKGALLVRVRTGGDLCRSAPGKETR
ncbi:MAG: acetyl-CoA carboxylase biotin carboxyl carrier protein subunit [Anaerolineae bacterium]